MNKYYILERDTAEGLSLKLPVECFDESVLECQELGEEPFTYDTLEEAKQVKNALNLIFKGRVSSTDFIIVEEINETN
tara:strand:+ start:503 stop:736 length:234 start_codon:yes stop_codon:yes gene_type:complete